MSGIRTEIREFYQRGNALNRLIMVNVSVFLIFMILGILAYLLNSDFHMKILRWVALPADPVLLLTRPWTIISSMFFHRELFHILFNMLYLYFAGLLFLQYFNGRKLLSVYILGGISGALCYVLAYNIFPVFASKLAESYALGASAGVMAVLLAIAAYAPQMEVRLFFVLKMKLWVVALIAVLIDLLTFTDGNQGGHIAHLGGALFGYLSSRSLHRNKDITEWFSRLMDRLFNLFKPKSVIRKVYSRENDSGYRERKVKHQHRMDEILDKISRSGYDSLSREEKDFLFKVGKD